ncbi:MAG: sigma-70 family RNA polymerase sigma factor [Cyanobacteria bacterium P01_G01_bin.49]
MRFCDNPNLNHQERQAIRRGEWALRKLLESHYGLIQTLVNTYAQKGYNHQGWDLEAEAITAFYEAIATFDPTQETALSTWAYLQIRAKLQQVTKQSITYAMAKAKIKQHQDVYLTLTPLDVILFDSTLEQLTKKLTKKQRRVMSLYLKGWSWTEIAKGLKSTADAVRMLWRRAVERLQRISPQDWMFCIDQ